MNILNIFKEVRKIGKIPGGAQRDKIDFGSMREHSTFWDSRYTLAMPGLRDR